MLTIAYDGTGYVGWQIQKNGLAVEQVINSTLSQLLNEDITVIGCSRTDSGVHARGNIAVFDTDTRIPPEKICYALNQRLPEDIRIVKSQEVPANFHPRHVKCKKTYEYSILNCRYNDPILRLYTDHIYYELDPGLMQRGADFLVGEHDFIAFSTAGGQQKTSVREIYSINVGYEYLDKDADQTNDTRRDYRPKLIKIRVCGNGFLYNMVRIIAGTLEKVGMGIYPPEYVAQILESRDRSKSAPKAPARGLMLVGIDYDRQDI